MENFAAQLVMKEEIQRMNWERKGIMSCWRKGEEDEYFSEFFSAFQTENLLNIQRNSYFQQ